MLCEELLMETVPGGGDKRLKVLMGHSLALSAELAVAELAEKIYQKQAALNIVFFDDSYDLEALGRSLENKLSGPVIGCTSSGQISSLGFQKGGIAGISLTADRMFAMPYLIYPLQSVTEQVLTIAADVRCRMEKTGWGGFGFLLIDGLSFREEVLTAALYRSLGHVPIFGGSAGDMLKFKQSFVYYDGQLYRDAAVFTIILTPIPFHIFKHQHLRPSSKRLVITAAEPAKRIVTEINGEPAATAYAGLVGVDEEQLTAEIFSRYPLLLQYRDDYYVRAIAGVGPGGLLQFYCAINSGLVLSLGKGRPTVKKLADTFNRVRMEIGAPAVIICCDCILRRLQLESMHADDVFGVFLAQNRVFGFSTYGEQFNSLHVNQTFTGVAIAG